MVPANKILTVAYGTFSCTLEGFDDPFSTMTDIAEYFRDLAAEDRFFGAEPPTPDMAMLRMIAETRAKHAVTARPEEGGVILSPSVAAEAARTPEPDAVAAAFDAAAVAAETAEAPAEPETEAEEPVEEMVAETPAMESVTEDTVADAEQVEDEPVEEPVAEDVAAEETAAEAEPAQDEPAVEVPAIEAPAPVEADDMAAKLARIRSVVEADRQSSSIYDEDEHAEDMIADSTDDPTDAPSEGRADDPMSAAFRDDVFVDDTAFDYVHTSDNGIAAEETRDETAEESVEVATTEAAIDVPAEADMPDTDEVEPDATETKAVEIGEDTLEADLAAILSDDAGTEADEMETAETQAIDAPEEASGRDAPEAEANAEEDAETEAAASADAEAEARAPRTVRIRRVRRLRRAVAAAASLVTPAAARPVAEPDTQEAEAAAEPEMQDIEAAEEAASDADDMQDDLMAELAAIEAELVRDPVGSAGSDDDASGDESDEMDDILARIDAAGDARGETADAADAGEDSASDDDDDILGLLSLDEDDEEDASDEDDLMAELAAIRATEDFVEDTREAETPDMAEDAPEEVAARSDEDEDESPVAEQEDVAAEVAPSAPDMERLFAATDSRLSGEDTSRRHANISHLKAAVAARRADGPIEPREDKETDAYRADLASSVRPRRAARPAGDGMPRAERPARPAPLVLVSEQRVVETPEAEAPAAPVQPRRAPRLTEAETQEQERLKAAEKAAGAEDFEQFAADVGATDLPDILEAAAVYSARIMGQDNFSRPRLLHLAAEACDDLSREDGLRGFGQLLRDGRIRKVSRGTFALAAESRYAADADRRAG